MEWYTMLYQMYIEQPWEYAGGNHDYHLRYYKIVWHDQPEPEERVCYLCQRAIESPDVFYITNYFRKIPNYRKGYLTKKQINIKVIGQCCFSTYDPIKRPRLSVIHSLHPFMAPKQKTD